MADARRLEQVDEFIAAVDRRGYGIVRKRHESLGLLTWMRDVIRIAAAVADEDLGREDWLLALDVLRARLSDDGTRIPLEDVEASLGLTTRKKPRTPASTDKARLDTLYDSGGEDPGPPQTGSTEK